MTNSRSKSSVLDLIFRYNIHARVEEGDQLHL